MKKFLLLILTLSCAFFSEAQYVNIPDNSLRGSLVTLYPSSFNASQMMDTTSLAIINETVFTAPSGAVNFDGFQYFKNLVRADFSQALNVSTIPPLPVSLKYLYAGSTEATGLSNLPPNLLWLDCNGSQFTSLPVLPNSLEHFECIGCTVLQLPASLPASLKFFSIAGSYLGGSLPVLPSLLDTLVCGANHFSSLPILPSNLKMLDCSYCSWSTLPALPPQLKALACSGNPLGTLPALPSQLDSLSASYAQLTSLPVLPPQLKWLHVWNNNLSTLPALPATLIQVLCFNNQISTLPALPSSLQSLVCNDNQLTSIPSLPNSLTELQCMNNLLGSLPALPQSLEFLSCSDNQLTDLPALSQTSLTGIKCENNLLTAIPSLPASLYSLFCENNRILSLPALPQHLYLLRVAKNPIYFLPELPSNALSILDCRNDSNLTCLPFLPVGLSNSTFNIYISDYTGLNCIPNSQANMVINVSDAQQNPVSSVPASSFPLCSVVNNSNHCSAFPSITGHVFYDNNNNLIQDANEPYRANMRVNTFNGNFAFTNSDGYYQFAVNDTGSYSAAIEVPPYFTGIPLQHDYHFNTYDTTVTADFALQATTIRDSVSIFINPVNVAVRPGFPYPYQIVYANDGTTTLNSNVVFNYDNTRLIYDSCSNASVINTGNSLTLSEPGLVPGMQKSFIGYFRVNPSAILGDSLRSGAHITAGAVAAQDSAVIVIRGALDPNDKSATPKLTPAQVINGDYIYYTIRFQNTGTDTAFNIVVTDTLDSRLQPSTMQMIATSHPCITTVKNNTISFEFINILLPDSNVNPLKSHGYISFRIKPQSNLVVNDIVPNKAAIYFDYNSPVITNTAITTILDPIVVPLKLLSFIVSRGVGLNANLYWQTSNEVSVRNYEIEMSTNGRTFNKIGFENAKGYQNNNYTRSVAIPSNAVLYFRLKMIDIDGRYSYSNVAILKNDKANNAFTILNNPVNDELNISLQDESLRNTPATIFTAQGIKVRTVLLQHDIENINIQSLPAGTYYLVTGRGSRQFVVVR